MTNSDEGSISTEVRGHLFLIGLNRPKKYNGYTPTMAKQLLEAMIRLDEDKDLRVGVIFGHGDHFTAGLDLPKWTEGMADENHSHEGAEQIDVVGLGRACRKPIVTAVKGITFTFGIEFSIAGDIVIAADDCRFSQLEPKRAVHATGGATIRFVQRCGWGNAMYQVRTPVDPARLTRAGSIENGSPNGLAKSIKQPFSGR